MAENVPESRGLFICDACDTACSKARTIGIAPNAEQAAKLPKEKRRGLVLAFCKRCRDPKIIAEVCKKAAEQLNEWFKRA